MSTDQDLKFLIHKETKSQETPTSDEENFIPNKNLVGMRHIHNKSSQCETIEKIFEKATCSNSNGDAKTRSCSFDFLLNSLVTSDNDDIQFVKQKPANTNNMSFEEVMNKILTPHLAEFNIYNTSESTFSKEFCTETSFDEILTQLFTPSSTQDGIIYTSCCKNETELKNTEASMKEIICSMESDDLNTVEERSFVLDALTPSNPLTPVNSEANSKANVKINKDCKQCIHSVDVAENSKVNLKTAECCEKNTQHILHVLSQNVIVCSDGSKAPTIKLNSVSKIGTERWLQCALTDFGADAPYRGKYKITKVSNNYDSTEMTTCKKQILQSYRKGKIKIFRMNNIRASTVKDKDSSTQSIFSSDFSDNCDAETPTNELSEVENKLKLGLNEISKNKNLLYSDNDAETEIDKNKIKLVILDLFAKLYEVFQNDRVPCLYVRSRYFKNCIFSDKRFQLKSGICARLKTLNFNNLRGRLKIIHMLYVMGKTFTLLENNTKLTKRELFYQIKHLGITQRQINAALEEVTCLLNVGQWHLNVVANSGLVYGDLKLVWCNGNVTNCNIPATMIPYDLDDIVEVQSTACFILVVEKESIFLKLLEEDLPNKLARPFIMITGKGVPNFNTRRFLKKMSKIMSLPVFILVDADVYGIKIMMNYRFGSVKSCHLSHYLAVPNARWIGVFPSEISKFGIKHELISGTEKRIIKKMLTNPCVKSYPKLLEELNVLLNTEKKASIEGLIKNNTFLSESYLPIKFFKQNFI